MREGDDTGGEGRPVLEAQIGKVVGIDPCAHAANGRASAEDVGLGQHQGKFIAAVATHEVGGAHLPQQEPAQFGHDPIPHHGAEPLVVAAQVVDVEQHQAECQRVAAGPLKFFLDPPVERVRIAAAGEHVGGERAGLPPGDTGAAFFILQQSRRGPEQPLGKGELFLGERRILAPGAQQEDTGRPAVQVHRNHRDAAYVGTDAELLPERPDFGEIGVMLQIRDEHRLLGAERLADLRVAIQVDAEVTGGGLFADGDDAAVAFPRRGEQEGTAGQFKGEPDPSHQRLDDRIGAERGGELLEDVEHQLLTPHLLALGDGHRGGTSEPGGEAGDEFAEVHRGGERIVRPHGERLGQAFAVVLGQHHDAGNVGPGVSGECVKRTLKLLIGARGGD